MSDQTVELGPEEARPGRSIVRRGGIEDIARRFDLVKIFRGILRRLWLVVASSIAFALVFGALALHLQNIYVADAYLMFEVQTSKFLPENLPLGHFTMTSATEMVTLPAHLNAVRSILGLDMSEQELGKLIDVKPPLGDSNLIDITVSASNPNLATDIANTLASVVVKDGQEYAKRQLKSAYDYLASQATTFEQKISEKIQEIADFRRAHSFIDVTPEGLIAVKGMVDSEKRLQDAIMTYNGMLIEYENLRRETARMPDTVVRSTVEDNPMQRRLLQTELALLEAKTRYAPENPKIKVLEAELTELHAMLAKPQDQNPANRPFQQWEKNPVKEQLNLNLVGLRGKVRSAQMLKDDLTAAYDAQKKNMDNLPAEEMQFSRMLDEKTRYEQDLKDTEAVMKATDMMLKLGKGDIDLYLPAGKAQAQDNILVDLLPLIGFLVGIGFGLCLAAMLEVLDPKIRTSKELDGFYTVPCLLTIPELARTTPRNAEERLKPYVSYLEESLHRLLHGREKFTLAITSSIGGEGKSTLTYCLACLWQRLGKKVVVVEWDPSSASLFEPHQVASKTAVDYLRGQANLDEIIYRGEPCRVTVGAESDLKDIIRRGKMAQLVEELQRQFDVVLMDCPGIIERDYALNILDHVKDFVFIIGSNKVKREYVDASLHECELVDIRPIGLVLNRALKIFIDDVRVQVEGRQSDSDHASGLKSWFSNK